MLTTRPITKEDEVFVTKLLEEDELHKQLGLKWKDVVAPDTYAEAIIDEKGNILTIVRYHIAVRVAMQFNPEHKYKIASRAEEIIDVLIKRGRNILAKEIIIRPGGKAVNFAKKLGFKEFHGKYMEIL